MSLKQLISDEEKHALFRQILLGYEQNNRFRMPDLAEDLDFAKNTLYKIRKGTAPAPDILIYKFCEYFKLNPAYFFGRTKKLTEISKQSPLLEQSEILRLHELGLEIATFAAKILNKK